VQFLLSDGMMHSIAACAAIGTDCAKNAILLLWFTGRCLVTADCYDSKMFALSEYATIHLHMCRWAQPSFNYRDLGSVLLCSGAVVEYTASDMFNYHENPSFTKKNTKRVSLFSVTLIRNSFRFGAIL
jgi:hypothetical protein